MAYKFVCDVCDNEVAPESVVIIEVTRNGESTVAHTCAGCFDEGVSGDEDVLSTVLLGGDSS